MKSVYITGTGLFTPEQSISNAELVTAFNSWAENWNQQQAAAIKAGEVTAQALSSAEFIEKASGIKSRYVMDKEGILNPERMKPYLPERPDDQPCLQAEMAVKAAQQALDQADLKVNKSIWLFWPAPIRSVLIPP